MRYDKDIDAQNERGRNTITARAKIYIGTGLNAQRSGRGAQVNLDSDNVRSVVNGIVQKRFVGATITPARGYYLQRFEPSLVVEVWSTDTTGRQKFLADVMHAAHDLVRLLDQIAIAVVVQNTNGTESITYVGADTVGKRQSTQIKAHG